MKLLVLSFFLLVFTSCTQHTQEDTKTSKDSINLVNALLPEAEKHRLFKDLVKFPHAFDPSKHVSFREFHKKYYPYDSVKYKNYEFTAEYIYGANEELINPNKPGNRKWFRLFVIPAFESEFCITLEKTEHTYALTYRVFEPADRQAPNLAIFSYTDIIEDTSKYDAFFTMLDKKDFLSRKPYYPECQFHDAKVFVCEEINNGRYNKVELTEPWRSYCASDNDYYIILELIKLVKDSKIYTLLKEAFPSDREKNILEPYDFLEAILNTPRLYPKE